MQRLHSKKAAGTNTVAGFHEAIGDTLALAVNTPSHMQQVGLAEAPSSEGEARTDPDIVLEDGTTYSKGDINYLMSIALDKV